MQLGCAFPRQQLCNAQRGHRSCMKPVTASGIHGKRRVAAPAAAAAWRSSTSSSVGWLQPAPAGAPSCAPTLQRRQQLAHATRRVAAGSSSSSLSLPEPSGDGSSSSGQQRGSNPIACDAGNTMDPQVRLQHSRPSRLALACFICDTVCILGRVICLLLSMLL